MLTVRQTEADILLDDLNRSLLELAAEVEAAALQSGAVAPMSVVPEFVTDDGMEFVVWRRLQPKTSRLSELTPDSKPVYSETTENPFLPFDPRIRVAEISDTHVCLLNKYNIFDSHLLIVTREFEHQTRWLTEADFAALWRCIQEVDGLAFYNGGKIAGASQRHKHLQLIPSLPGTAQANWPIAAALDEIKWHGELGHLMRFPFQHTFGRLDLSHSASCPQAVDELLQRYHQLLAACEIPLGDGITQTRPYNLLATREWMMVVPRSIESYRGISVNALGFAGSLLVRDEEQLATIRDIGPMNVLKHVGIEHE